eukprot:365857-Chlamydomonas_euryale.AAC.6
MTRKGTTASNPGMHSRVCCVPVEVTRPKCHWRMHADETAIKSLKRYICSRLCFVVSDDEAMKRGLRGGEVPVGVEVILAPILDGRKLLIPPLSPRRQRQTAKPLNKKPSKTPLCSPESLTHVVDQSTS